MGSTTQQSPRVVLAAKFDTNKKHLSQIFILGWWALCKLANMLMCIEYPAKNPVYDHSGQEILIFTVWFTDHSDTVDASDQEY